MTITKKGGTTGRRVVGGRKTAAKASRPSRKRVVTTSKTKTRRSKAASRQASRSTQGKKTTVTKKKATTVAKKATASPVKRVVRRPPARSASTSRTSKVRPHTKKKSSQSRSTAQIVIKEIVPSQPVSLRSHLESCGVRAEDSAFAAIVVRVAKALAASMAL